MQLYFGPKWDAPSTDPPARQVDTPIGRSCGWCEVVIVDGDQGFLIPGVRLTSDGEPYPMVEPWHRECSLRSSTGNVDHLEGRCTCYGGTDGHTTMTPRERRDEALAVWEWITAQRDPTPPPPGRGPLPRAKTALQKGLERWGSGGHTGQSGADGAPEA